MNLKRLFGLERKEAAPADPPLDLPEADVFYREDGDGVMALLPGVIAIDPPTAPLDPRLCRIAYLLRGELVFGRSEPRQLLDVTWTADEEDTEELEAALSARYHLNVLLDPLLSEHYYNQRMEQYLALTEARRRTGG